MNAMRKLLMEDCTETVPVQLEEVQLHGKWNKKRKVMWRKEG